ncbi:MAG: hypothetical protein HRU12_24025, partial [Phaeodactylibacter sp.]|nr:hypothetical protein [Phaeodactylibacter sp.]
MRSGIFYLVWSLLCFTAIHAPESTINAGWKFLINETANIEDLPEVDEWSTVNIPHTWNNIDAFDDDDGYLRTIGWYQKAIFLPDTDQNMVFLKFEGAYQWSKLYVNGEFAGEHKGGYTAFALNISKFIKLDAQNTILVQVDSRHNSGIPPLSGDFTFYGGIYRDVQLIRTGAYHFDRLDGSTKGVYINGSKVSERSATLAVNTKVRNHKTKTGKLTVRTLLFAPGGQQVAKAEAPLRLSAGASGVASSALSVSQPKLWSPDHPNLYRVEVRLLDEKGEAVDEYITRYGFRWFEMDESRAFILNGKPIDLIG